MRRPARPVFAAVFAILLFAVQRPSATAQIPGGMLGPNAPALVDTNNNGRPTPGVDLPIIPTFDSASNVLTIVNPWQDCNGSGALHNGWLFSFNPSTGLPDKATRDRGDQIETIIPTGYFSPTEPDAFHMTVTKGGTIIKQGDLALIDSGHGYFSGISIDGSVVASIDFTYADLNYDGIADFISLPWGQTAALGVKMNFGCGPGGTTPQIWIPLINNQIVLDLDGNGQPDPNFFASPPLAPGNLYAIIPTLSTSALVLFAATLLGVGLFQLRRVGLGF